MSHPSDVLTRHFLTKTAHFGPDALRVNICGSTVENEQGVLTSSHETFTPPMLTCEDGNDSSATDANALAAEVDRSPPAR